jgi:uncharacterized protein
MTATTSRPHGLRTTRGWTSALYEGQVRHRRLGPVEHGFHSRVSMALLDLSELDEVVSATPLWSSTRRAPVRFRRTDYLDGTDRPLAEALGDLVEARLGRRPSGPYLMLTQLRTWGWLFNPITIYWCSDGGDESPGVGGASDRLDAVVLEVTNTPWHDRHWYVLDARSTGLAAAPTRFGKELHVSPFLPMDLDYRLTIAGPADEISVRLEVLRDDRPVLDADLDLRRVELTPAHAVAALVRSPLSTFRVSATIRLQALRLWTKRVPVHRRPVAP